MDATEYRLLRPTERTEEGDEMWDHHGADWVYVPDVSLGYQAAWYERPVRRVMKKEAMA